MNRYKLLFSLLIIVTTINCYIFYNRLDYAYIKQSSYYELYPKIRNPAIHHFDAVNDSTLLIRLTRPSASPLTWVVTRNNQETITLNQSEPAIALKQGVSTYSIFSNSLPDTLSIKVEYYPNDHYNKIGNTQKGGILIYQADLPHAIYPYDNQKWGVINLPVSKEEEVELATVLKDSMQIKQNDNTVEKIKKLGKFLCLKIANSRGFPTGDMMALSVFQQYKAGLKGQPLWCGMYGQIFTLFANAAHIKNRYVEIKQSYGAIAGSIHVFNEYFIPEQKKWAAIDLMFNNIQYMDGAGNLLNAVEVKNTDPAANSVSVMQASQDGLLISSPFAQLENDFFDYYGPNKNLYYYGDVNGKTIYSFKEKIIRYLDKASWFEVYSEFGIVDNRSFYVKQLFIYI